MAEADLAEQWPTSAASLPQRSHASSTKLVSPASPSCRMVVAPNLTATRPQAFIKKNENEKENEERKNKVREKVRRKVKKRKSLNLIHSNHHLSNRSQSTTAQEK